MFYRREETSSKQVESIKKEIIATERKLKVNKTLKYNLKSIKQADSKVKVEGNNVSLLLMFTVLFELNTEEKEQ